MMLHLGQESVSAVGVGQGAIRAVERVGGAGDAATITMTVIPAGGSFSVTTEVTSNETDHVPGNDSQTITIPVEGDEQQLFLPVTTRR